MPGLGRVSLWAKICQGTHRCSFFFWGWTQVGPPATHSLMEKRKHMWRQPHHGATPPPSKPSPSHLDVQRDAPVCGAGGMEAVRRNFPESVSNCAEQMARCDTAERFYGDPQWSHLSCDHLCLPPAIGQGSYNSRLGGPGPLRMLPRLSRCGDGTGRRISYCRRMA